MTGPNLGLLQRVPLRKVWNDEAADFTPWLARPENLKLLGESLGIELELEEIERNVGPYSADILCKDTSDGSWVVIENQIVKTDHSHLGQVLTYAAALGARTLVWIASEFTDQHRSVLDWLNTNTVDGVSVFGIEVEALKIGDSSPAVRFNLVSKPNNWSRSARSQVSREGVSEHKQLLYDFWAELRSWISEKNVNIRLQKPSYQNWLTSGSGRSNVNYNLVISSWNSITNTEIPEVRVEIWMNAPNGKMIFSRLEERSAEIQNRIDLPLTWHNLENSKSCKIYLRRDGDFRDKRNWPELFEWLTRNLIQFREVFGPLIKD